MSKRKSPAAATAVAVAITATSEPLASPSKRSKVASDVAAVILSPAKLWTSRKVSEWQVAAAAYDTDALAASFALRKSRPSAVASLKEYARLDSMLRALAGATSVTKEQMLHAVNWKHTRGKLRPNFNKVATNSAASIEAASRRAFAYLDAHPPVAGASSTDGESDSDADESNGERAVLHTALNYFSDPLHGVGPMTASALLAAGRPDRFAFGSDELLALVLRGRKPAYNAAELLLCCTKLRRKATLLGGCLTVADMERAVFAAHMLAK